jgi:acyl carrier protein
MGIFKSIKSVFVENNSTVIDGNDVQAVTQWLSQRMANQLKIDSTKIDPSKPFEEYGLDSMFAVKVTGELEKVVEMRLSPALLFENTCISDVANVIAKAA